MKQNLKNSKKIKLKVNISKKSKMKGSLKSKLIGH